MLYNSIHPSLSITRGWVYIVLLRFYQALEVFQRAAQRFPCVKRSHVNRSMLTHWHSWARSAAIAAMQRKPRFLRRAIALNSKHFNAYHDLGRLLLIARRYEDAVPILQRAATLTTNDPDVHYQLFLAFSRLKRKADADREFTTFQRLTEEQKSKSN